MLSRFSLVHRASEGIQDSSCSWELRTFAWHSEHLSHPAGRGERVIVGFFPISGISSTHFGSTSLPSGAKELLTSRQVMLHAGMRWEVMLD